MQLIAIDWLIIVSFLALSLAIGFAVAKRSGKNTTEYFLSGRSMPWWMLGMSMVATTFSTDTPNLVTDLVRQKGVANNWQWWAFLITGMLTVFVYAKLWRRSKVLTDMEFYELRYSGKAASFLRGFRALYLGLAFNVLAMSAVTLAAIKIGQVMFNFHPITIVVVAGLVTVIFSALGGFRGVIITDCILFVTAIGGALIAAYFALSHPAVGSFDNLISHPNVVDKLQLIPTLEDRELFITVLIIPIAVQWWSVWYPGSEPGGGGYVAQRMLAAKDEKHAIGATFFFNVTHYALRPWPWILVALASLIVYPDLNSLREAFPNITENKIGHDLGYPAMLTHVPAGWLGLIMASLIAAYMSTISTHLNWGASYVVHDCYHRFFRPKASDRELIWISRLVTVGLMIFAALIALSIQNAKQVFDLIILFGAGTGLIFLLRWFWWRINAWAELVAMIGSGFISLILINILPDAHDLSYLRIPISVALTTVLWITTMYLTPATSEAKLRSFYTLIKPAGPGWNAVLKRSQTTGQPLEPSNDRQSITYGIICTFLGTLMVYTALFATGYAIYQHYITASILLSITLICALLIFFLWPKVAITETVIE
ncbi:Sodium/glucose cotransporter [Poriferisphaera corsica]|uniref:Sodium/glucose cotransporter n=1 Tax=Poriferisphaera corsica TaxID=2528020 RepID=A0A517YUL4_9BACT|nr:sodium:solute symporter family protein [Poriferisphaera corsica]QDU33914.1 Sodium/glucose cotransporter [Poriferisphaera corsica]